MGREGQQQRGKAEMEGGPGRRESVIFSLDKLHIEIFLDFEEELRTEQTF